MRRSSGNEQPLCFLFCDCVVCFLGCTPSKKLYYPPQWSEKRFQIYVRLRLCRVYIPSWCHWPLSGWTLRCIGYTEDNRFHNLRDIHSPTHTHTHLLSDLGVFTYQLETAVHFRPQINKSDGQQAEGTLQDQLLPIPPGLHFLWNKTKLLGVEC